MTINISAEYVRDSLALQSYTTTPEAASAIAAGLAAQLSKAASAYGALVFEDEPAAFSAALNGARR